MKAADQSVASWNAEAWDWQDLRNDGQASRYREIVKLIVRREPFVNRLVFSSAHSLTGFPETGL